MSRSLRPVTLENRVAWYFDRMREPFLKPIECKFCAEKTKQPRGDCWSESLSGQWVCPACYDTAHAPQGLGEAQNIEGDSAGERPDVVLQEQPGVTFEGCHFVGGRWIDGQFVGDDDTNPPLPTKATTILGLLWAFTSAWVRNTIFGIKD